MTTIKWKVQKVEYYIREFDDRDAALAEELLKDPERLEGYETADTLMEEWVVERELGTDEDDGFEEES